MHQATCSHTDVYLSSKIPSNYYLGTRTRWEFNYQLRTAVTTTQAKFQWPHRRDFVETPSFISRRSLDRITSPRAGELCQ